MEKVKIERADLRRRNLGWLPVIGSNIEGKTIDTSSVCGLNVGSPIVLSVRIGIAHHMVGHYELLAVVSLGNFAVTKRRANIEGRCINHTGRDKSDENESEVHFGFVSNVE